MHPSHRDSPSIWAGERNGQQVEDAASLASIVLRPRRAPMMKGIYNLLLAELARNDADDDPLQPTSLFLHSQTPFLYLSPVDSVTCQRYRLE